MDAAPDKEIPGPFKPPVQDEHAKAGQEDAKAKREPTPEQPEDPKSARNEQSTRAERSSRAPSFVPVSEPEPTTPPIKRTNMLRPPPMSSAAYRLEADSLNILMNQVLEQMEKGPVNLNLVARIKAHPMYDARPMVKELLESIMAAQSEKIQRETSKLVQQQSQDVSRKQQVQQKASVEATKPAAAAPPAKRPEKLARSALGERPWVSVEVGFEQEEESDLEANHQQSVASNATEVTVQTTSFEDSDDQHEAEKKKVATAEKQMDRETQTLKEEEEADTEDEEEYTDSEMEELADEVEHKIVVEPADNIPPPDPVVAQPQFLDAFDRGLVKRQSKGKYQVSKIFF
ncbi:hypothetical protein OESDEN_06331 [Oesophagostomum dentatum]|uniref:Uncharacterized protein n=1 Tax=Oesophagostomum dentatum TaxID=61180 RepID=A0A0B1TD49_OESDE|nr:hypothetical protein OESDEN_06331 [Oesophagostomum dentatum]